MKLNVADIFFSVTLPCMVLILLLTSGCYSVIANREVNLKGVWFCDKFQSMIIISDRYMLTWRLKDNSAPYKCRYEIVKNNGIWIKRGTSWMRLKEDSKGLYWDSTSYWLGFIPIYKAWPGRKISDVEALEIIKKYGKTKAEVMDVSIKDLSDGRISIPDHSAPEIFDRL